MAKKQRGFRRKQWWYKATILTREIINSLAFIEKARRRASDFTRARKLTLRNLVMYMLSLRKGATETELRRFFKENGLEGSMRQQSYSESRQKLNPDAIKDLQEEVAQVPYQSGDFIRRFGYRVLAIDGTTIALPDSKEMKENYGCSGKGLTSPTAQASILYDVCNDVILHGEISEYSKGERELALKHISANIRIAGVPDLLLLDRGYPSAGLFVDLAKDGYSFVMRCRSKFNNAVDSAESGDTVSLKCKDEGEFKVKVVKFMLSSGEQEILLTNIFDSGFTDDEFKKIYCMRWCIESEYDRLKNKLQLENFTGRTVTAIRQDFYASLYMANMVAFYKRHADEEIETKNEGKQLKHRYNGNCNHIIGVLKDYFVASLLEDKPRKRDAIFNAILLGIERSVVPVRPNRSIPRSASPRKSKFHHNRKSAL